MRNMISVAEIINYTIEDILKNIDDHELDIIIDKFNSLVSFLKEYKQDAEKHESEFFNISNYLKLI